MSLGNPDGKDSITYRFYQRSEVCWQHPATKARKLPARTVTIAGACCG
jgi:hypothetical protein